MVLRGILSIMVRALGPGRLRLEMVKLAHNPRLY
jgi:hypothetical protein